MDKKIRFALVGAGFIADYHVRALQKLDCVEIKAVAAIPVESAKAFAEKYGITHFTDDANSLTVRDDIEAVIIATPNKFHAPFAINFLKNKKDVFLEKPLAMNFNEGQKVAEVATQKGQLAMVGHMWRFDTEVKYIKDIIQSDKIGKIFKTKGYGIHENWGPGGWFSQKELAGGGALADMGVHAIDTVRFILGDPEPIEVYAKIGTYFGQYDVDDSGIIMVTWGNGTTSIIESGWWHPHMDGPEAGTRLFGTKGYASLFPTELKFKVNDQAGNFKVEMPVKEEHCDQSIYDRQMEYFVDCIIKRITPSPGLKEGLAVLKIVDAAYESSESRHVVKLND